MIEKSGIARWAAVAWLAAGLAAGLRAAPVPEELARGGRAALEDGQYALAERLFREWLAAVPADGPAAAEARVCLARTAHGRKAFREMLEILPPDRAPPRGEPQAGAWRYYRALALHELGAQDEALAELDDVEAADGAGLPPGEALRLRAWAYMKQAKWPEADRAYADWAAAMGPAGPPARPVEAWAEALTAAGRYEAAEKALRDALASPAVAAGEPAHMRLRYWLGRALWGRGAAAEAEQEWTAVTAAETAPAIRLEAWLARAGLEEARTNLAAASVAASNAVSLAEGPAASRRTRTAWGLLLLKAPDPAPGAALLRRIIAESPADSDSPALQLAVARAYMNAGRPADAEAQFRYYIESFPKADGLPAALEGRAWALFELARYAEAAVCFEQAAALAGEPAERLRLTHKAADAYFANRQFKLAGDAYRLAAAGPADDARTREARFQIAETEARLNRPAEARALFEALEAEWPGSEWAERAALRVAELHQDEGALATAMTAYDRFLAVYTNTARAATALYNRGLVAYQMYRFERAFGDFEDVLARFPASPHAENAAYMRVCAAFEWNHDARAEEMGAAFLTNRPASVWVPQVLFRMAEQAFNRGGYEEAERQFADLAARPGVPEPTVGDALFWAARAAAARKEFTRAVEYDTRLAREHAAHPKAGEALFYQAESLVELGDYAGAAALFEEVIHRLPGSYLADAALGRRGDCQFTLGAENPARFEDAIRSYNELAENANAALDLRLQAAFKSGRAQQKLDRTDAAFEQYYTGVILPYLEARRSGMAVNDTGTAWFTRAAFEAASILEGRGRWREAIRIYQRAADAGVPAADDAKRRIETIRREHWRFL